MTLTLDSPKLRDLTRTQLQSLAKREVVRAVGKTEEIIRRLIRKHPMGVPVSQDGDNPSASSAPPFRELSEPSNDIPPSSPVRETSQQHYADAKGKSKAIAEPASSSPSPSSSVETLKLLYPEDELGVGPPNASAERIFALHAKVDEPGARLAQPAPSPGEPPRVAPLDSRQFQNPPTESQDVPGWRADEEDEEQDQDQDDAVDGYLKGAPTHYMVVDALRRLTAFTNTIPTMETSIAEGRCLLRRAEKLLDKATPDARQLVVTREYLETFLLGKMKRKRELWDGTGKMEKKERKVRMEWLRAERRAEDEKTWREMNELYKKYGVKEEPLSAFVSESDEEVIESLQTTPASSKSGGSKRTREDGPDVELDADSGVGQSEKKRARSE